MKRRDVKRTTAAFATIEFLSEVLNAGYLIPLCMYITDAYDDSMVVRVLGPN